MLTHLRELTQYWSSRVYPTGEFTVGYIPPKKKTEKEAKWDDLSEFACKRHYYETHHYGGTQIRYVDERHDTTSQEFIDKYMGLSHPVNSHNPAKRKRKGTNGITSYSRRLIKSAAALLQQRFGRKRLTFVTLTLPSLPKYSEEIILTDCGGWSEILRQSLQEFRREIIRKGGNGEIVGCVEIQEKRYKKYGVVAPHIHIIFEGHKGDYKYYVSKEKCLQIWQRIVEKHLEKVGIEERIDYSACTRIESIKKNAANYIGKYMSKGGEIVAKIIEDEKSNLLPTCWVICTSKLRKLVKLYTFSMVREHIEMITKKHYEECDKIFEYLFPVTRIWKGEEISFGYAGKYKQYKVTGKELYEMLL